MITRTTTVGSFALATACLALLAGPASAAVLAQYNFDTDLAATTTGANVTATDVSDGGGFGATGNDSNDPTNPWNGETTPSLVFGTFGVLDADSPAGQQSDEDAHTSGDYLEFTVTPDSGWMLNLDSLTFDGERHIVTANTNVSISLRSSLDNFGSVIDKVEGQAGTILGFSGNPVSHTFDLSGTSFQGVTDPVTFRVVMWSDKDLTFRGFGVDDLTLNGETVVVPEPSAAAAMLGLGGMGLLNRRRR